MPKKSGARDNAKLDASFASSQAYSQATSAPPDMLATPNHANHGAGPPGPQLSRPTLPPLSYLHTGSQFLTSPSSTSTVSYSGAGSHVPSSQYNSPTVPQTFSAFGSRTISPNPVTAYPSRRDHYGSSAAGDPVGRSSQSGHSYNPLKRPHETSAPSERSSYVVAPFVGPTGEMNDYRSHAMSNSASNVSTPTTASHPAFGYPQATSSAPSTSSGQMSRFSLHIRQQPRAARAGPDGKDRRPVDPPPVLQLLMTDFNMKDETEVEKLHSRYWVAHCRLVSASSPRHDISTLRSTGEDGSNETQRLLLGTSVASPFHTKDDPDPATMPLHPFSDTEPTEAPASPSIRFFRDNALNRSSHHPPPPHLNPRAGSTPATPCTFFIFADVSVRKAGEYRLEFSLMHMDPISLSRPGYNVPILCTIASNVFKVVNAKDFDQVKASTRLVRGLVGRGAGFPLKLKKGTRVGEGRRSTRDSVGEDDGSIQDDEGSDFDGE